MEIKEYYCRGTMESHEADYWRCKLIDQYFPLFGIAEREDYIAIGFNELNDLIHARFLRDPLILCDGKGFGDHTRLL